LIRFLKDGKDKEFCFLKTKIFKKICIT